MAPGVDGEAGHRHEGCHAAVDEVTPVVVLNQNAGLKPSPAGERTSSTQELHEHTVQRRQITHWIGTSIRSPVEIINRLLHRLRMPHDTLDVRLTIIVRLSPETQ
jgi:hypothetical protein